LNHLHQILEGDELRGRLDLAALDIACIQCPGTDPQPTLDQLNEIAARLGDRLRNFNDGREFVETAQSYLFEELGFRGNEENFSDPLNSCLDQVLQRRTGIPISLAVFYMEVARRLQMPVFGIGLPRHFVVQFDDGRFSTFIDPYGGKQLTPNECFQLAGARLADPSLLTRVTNKQIVIRMLNNLLISYAGSRDFPRAIQTLDLMLKGAPGQADWYRHRGMLLIEDQRYSDARRDLERYLALEPLSEERDEVLRQMEKIQLKLARLN
jgi:regulator of sirC expression with transglutaminase-like and TPR domain